MLQGNGCKGNEQDMFSDSLKMEGLQDSHAPQIRVRPLDCICVPYTELIYVYI